MLNPLNIIINFNKVNKKLYKVNIICYNTLAIQKSFIKYDNRPFRIAGAVFILKGLIHINVSGSFLLGGG